MLIGMVVQELPIELIGGPFDGRRTEVSPGVDGLPQKHLTVRWRRRAVTPDGQTSQVLGSGTVGAYERTMISDDTHRWRYVWCTPED